MRGDERNTGCRAEPLELRPDLELGIFKTGNAIFSTPVIDAEEKIYVGSADQRFYAIDPLAGRTPEQAAACGTWYVGFCWPEGVFPARPDQHEAAPAVGMVPTGEAAILSAKE